MKPNAEHPRAIDARSNRRRTTALGFPIKAKTLSTKATRGGGPPYQLFGPWVLYRWGDALKWAQARRTTPVDRLRKAMRRLRATPRQPSKQGGHTQRHGIASVADITTAPAWAALPLRAPRQRGKLPCGTEHCLKLSLSSSCAKASRS